MGGGWQFSAWGRMEDGCRSEKTSTSVKGFRQKKKSSEVGVYGTVAIPLKATQEFMKAHEHSCSG